MSKTIWSSRLHMRNNFVTDQLNRTKLTGCLNSARFGQYNFKKFERAPGETTRQEKNECSKIQK